MTEHERLTRIESLVDEVRVLTIAMGVKVDVLWNAHRNGGLNIKTPVETRLGNRERGAILVALITAIGAVIVATLA